MDNECLLIGKKLLEYPSGVKASQVAKDLSVSRHDVNHYLYLYSRDYFVKDEEDKWFVRDSAKALFSYEGEVIVERSNPVIVDEPTLSDLDRENIYKIVSENNGVTKRDIAAKLKLNPHLVNSYLYKNSDIFCKIGNNRWVLKKSNESNTSIRDIKGDESVFLELLH